MNRRSFFATLFALPVAVKAKALPPMGRPCLTINRIPEFISGSQISNYYARLAEVDRAFAANIAIMEADLGAPK